MRINNLKKRSSVIFDMPLPQKVHKYIADCLDEIDSNLKSLDLSDKMRKELEQKIEDLRYALITCYLELDKANKRIDFKKCERIVKEKCPDLLVGSLFMASKNSHVENVGKR